MDLSMPHGGGRAVSNWIIMELIEELRTGIYADSTTLPAELELAAKHKCSRSVIRDVLGHLEREGFVERIRGVGTSIHRDIVNLGTRLDLNFEYNGLIESMGAHPTNDSINVYNEPAGKYVAAQLGIDPASEVVVCEKRMLADGRPVIFSIDRIPLAFLHDIPSDAIDWGLSIFDILEEHCGITVGADVAHLSPALGPPDVREKLDVANDEALILIDEVGYYELSHPIFHTYGYYTDFFEFAVLRKRF
jgi:GntR family transcriptional regulator